MITEAVSGRTVYVTFEPTQIKSVIGNTGAFDPRASDVRFRRTAADAETSAPGTPADPRPDDLVVLHNVTEENLMKAIRIGDMPGPSIGSVSETRSQGCAIRSI